MISVADCEAEWKTINIQTERREELDDIYEHLVTLRTTSAFPLFDLLTRDDLAEFLWPDDKELSTFFRHEKYIPPPEEEEKVVVDPIVIRISPPWKVTYTKSKFQSLRITPN